MKPEIIIRFDQASYELLTEVFDEALESENVSLKTKRDFSSLLNDIRLQAKQTGKMLMLQPQQKNILAAVLREKLSRMQYQQSKHANITPGIKKLFTDSEHHMSNLISQLHD